MKKTQQGFTLIELMIVVAIIGILAAIAIPASQDYTIRSKVSEGINMASAAKSAVSEYRISQGSFPTDNAEAGLEDTISTDYVTSVVVSGGVITVTYSSGLDSQVSGDTVTFSPAMGSGAVTWACDGGSLDSKYRPAKCR